MTVEQPTGVAGPRGDPPGPARAVLQRPDVAGADLVAAWTAEVDRWLRSVWEEATGEVSPAGRLALVAVGGYGRAELCPGSDLDLLLVHAGGRRGGQEVAEVAQRLWYPVWDAGLKLGHAVRTVKEAMGLAADDLDTATALLDVRLLAGDPSLADELAAAALDRWQRTGRRWLQRLAQSVEERHAQRGEVAFLLEPDLKESRGGLRDVHALRWAEKARQVLLDGDHHSLDRDHHWLLGVRAELHRQTGRPGDVLRLEEQDAVATALRCASADDLMARVAGAGRAIAWRSDETWHRIESLLMGPGAARARPVEVGPGLVLRDREVFLEPDARPADDPVLALRAAAAAASHGARLHRSTLDRLAAEAAPMPDPWPEGGRDALVELLRAGHPAVPLIEALDHMGVWGRILPEWDTVRSRPQRNALHRFTVDRHLCEAAGNAAGLAGSVARPDLLVLGALLHDIGKGVPGRDHTEAGIDLVHRIGPRLGLPPADVEVLVALVRHHLLLPDVASRRDISDPATVGLVADAVGTAEVLELLHALTEADGEATGPAAWGTWKAGLVRTLVQRVATVLGQGTPPAGSLASFPTADQREMLAARERRLLGEGSTLTVVVPDRPGLLSRVAGVLALHGLDVLALDAAGADGWALEVITVARAEAPGVEAWMIPWERVTADLALALDGRLALEARLAERIRSYASSRRRTAGPVEVVVDDEASATATVVEVHAPDAMGLLHRITRAIADLDLDVRTAKVQTLGERVVDTFYVVDADGGKLVDADHLRELRRALTHAAR